MSKYAFYIFPALMCHILGHRRSVFRRIIPVPGHATYRSRFAATCRSTSPLRGGKHRTAAKAMDGRERPMCRSTSAAKAMEGRERPTRGQRVRKVSGGASPAGAGTGGSTSIGAS